MGMMTRIAATRLVAWRLIGGTARGIQAVRPMSFDSYPWEGWRDHATVSLPLARLFRKRVLLCVCFENLFHTPGFMEKVRVNDDR